VTGVGETAEHRIAARNCALLQSQAHSKKVKSCEVSFSIASVNVLSVSERLNIFKDQVEHLRLLFAGVQEARMKHNDV
jgi:hypothetical protein